jgi:pimeloyl-ACP methyl ester carboxylesterase
VASFTRGGVRLWYETRGTGNPVVLLHGFTSLSGSWERNGLVQALVAHGFRAISPDARSHGSSDPVFDPALCTTDVLAADVIELLDRLGIDSASLVGFSMGGGTALRVALDAPERVMRLVVGGVGDSAINALHDPGEVRELEGAFSGRADPPARSNAARLRRNAELAGNDRRALLPFLQQGGWPGGLTGVSPLVVPALVIVAAADEYMPRSDALLAALAPTQVLHLREHGHHGVMAHELVQQEVIRFLTSRLPSRGGSLSEQ